MMLKASKHIFLIIGVLTCFYCRPKSVLAQSERIEMDFGKETISAKIRDAPLSTVIDRIREEKGVWFKLWLKDNASILEERVSLQFEGVSVQKGLKRIFSSLNYSIVFDENKKVLGVILFGSPKPGRNLSRTRRVTPRRTPSRYRRR